MLSEKGKNLIKMTATPIALIWLSFAGMLSFLSMALLVAFYFMPTVSYAYPFAVSAFIALFLLISQLIPGYFATSKKYMYLTLVFSAIVAGTFFSLLTPLKGGIDAAACAFGNFLGYHFRIKRE